MSRHRSGSTTSRRRYLALAAATAGSLAGCLGGGSDSGDRDGSPATKEAGTTNSDETTTDATTTAATNAPAETTTTAATTAGSATTGMITGGRLDLHEANVVGVDIESTDEGYRFDVTLYHDDEGEDGYANWWQVETTGGERLGRRELAHPHGTERFTRSATIEIPDGTSRVVVRGHDRTHGYGGQAMLVTLETGATETVGQGPETRSFGGNGSASATTGDGG